MNYYYLAAALWAVSVIAFLSGCHFRGVILQWENQQNERLKEGLKETDYHYDEVV